ncbi:NADPH:quinone reductase-like Zn-dependent oxidoreductase [Agromyces sp. 3263]|uniref:NAD(P)-dependent alcohol dehydrogenase n=1 Tax=Agromyces sp. 3263 TaxID=2817750 RepID=UPI0028602B33|nr:NAD(P)-dependent alcohol dehydrogenase [Agromyces sp. 3263]MDR6904984.1 NADPH:quinone reductase-like Zn-dependent oxidoreductase [Agromyces sp. 3263]
MTHASQTVTTTTTRTMRAAVHRRFGPPEVVHLERVPVPVPKADELLVRVHASTVSIADHRTRSRDLPKGLWFFIPVALGVFRPRKRLLGMDIAGVVESVGGEVTGFAPGDEVIAMLGGDFGGHAEYARVPQRKAIARKPRNLDMGEAAALVFGGHTALAFLGLVPIGPGTEVLVNGASSAVGTAAVQLAAARGATVTAVCGARNVALAAELGAAHVIDYGAEDFTHVPGAYDVIVDCVGNASFDDVEHLLKPGGALLLVIADLSSMTSARRNSRRSGKLVTFTGGPVSHDDLAGLVRLAEEGRFRPVIDRTYALDDIVEAHRYVDAGHKTGNVVLRIA